MKIALLTLGTRGDVQPYAVLGRALHQRGHDVVLATARNFASLAQEYGIGFAPVEADFQALVESEEGKGTTITITLPTDRAMSQLPIWTKAELTQ